MKDLDKIKKDCNIEEIYTCISKPHRFRVHDDGSILNPWCHHIFIKRDKDSMSAYILIYYPASNTCEMNPWSEKVDYSKNASALKILSDTPEKHIKIMVKTIKDYFSIDTKQPVSLEDLF